MLCAILLMLANAAWTAYTGRHGGGGSFGGIVWIGDTPLELKISHWYWGMEEAPVRLKIGPIILRPAPITQYFSSFDPEVFNSFPWEAQAFGPARHMTFRRSDGTLTDPLPVAFGFDKVPGDDKWSTDGTTLVLNPTVPELAEVVPGTQRFWKNMPPYALEGLLTAVFWTGLGYVFFFLLTKEQLWIRLRPHQCPECRYDLRGNPDSGCPECGWNREG